MDILDKTYDRASCEIEDILQHQKFDKQDVELLGELIDIVKDVEMIYDYKKNISNDSMRSRNVENMENTRSMMNMVTTTPPQNGNKSIIITHLHNIMNMATDEKDRMAISKLVQEMESH